VLVARPAEHAEPVEESALASLGGLDGLGQDGEQPALDVGGGQHGSNYRMVYSLQLQCANQMALFFPYSGRQGVREARLRIV